MHLQNFKRKSLGEAGPSLGTRDDVDDKEQVLPDAAADNDGFETVLYKAIALYDYKAQDGDELSISKGQQLANQYLIAELIGQTPYNFQEM